MRYLATLIGATDEQTMRWFILVVAMLLDPAAVLLLMVAQMTSLPGPDRPDFLGGQGAFFFAILRAYAADSLPRAADAHC